MKNRRIAMFIFAGGIIAACSSADTPPRAEQSAGDVVPTGAAPAVRLVVDTTGTAVRYRVRERLVGNELDNDAIGVTRAVSGQIALAADGSVVP